MICPICKVQKGRCLANYKAKLKNICFNPACEMVAKMLYQQIKIKFKWQSKEPAPQKGFTKVGGCGMQLVDGVWFSYSYHLFDFKSKFNRKKIDELFKQVTAKMYLVDTIKNFEKNIDSIIDQSFCKQNEYKLSRFNYESHKIKTNIFKN